MSMRAAPAPVTAFVATVSKGAVFGLLLRYFSRPDIPLNSSLFLLFSVMAVASMFIGNLLALFQRNVKRILAYSSIAHIGYLLVAFLAGGPFMITSVTFYLVAYFVTTLAAFGIIIVLSGADSEADTLDHYHSLAWSRPWTTCIFTAALLSLAGIPLTAGFLGKFYLLSCGCPLLTLVSRHNARGQQRNRPLLLSPDHPGNVPWTGRRCR